MRAKSDTQTRYATLGFDELGQVDRLNIEAEPADPLDGTHMIGSQAHAPSGKHGVRRPWFFFRDMQQLETAKPPHPTRQRSPAGVLRPELYMPS